jgi:hypothetical protein
VSELGFGPYWLCGWRVTSALVLPELLPAPERLSSEPRLRIELGAVSCQDRSRHFKNLGNEGVVFYVPGTAWIHVNPAGDCVTVQLEPESDPLLVRNFLYGSVLAVLCYRWGWLPVHGSSVRIGDAALIFSGPSGAGKSTMAMAMVRRGHALVSDDVCAIDFSSSTGPRLWPAISRVKLLGDAIDCFQLGAASVYTRAAMGEKGHFGMAAIDAAPLNHEPVPVAAIYMLDTGHSPCLDRVLLQGKDRFVALEAQMHRAWMGRELGLSTQMFTQIARLAGSIPVYKLLRPRSLDAIEPITSFLEAMHGATAGMANSVSPQEVSHEDRANPRQEMLHDR